MENPKYILVMRQVASDYDGISHDEFAHASFTLHLPDSQ